MWPLRDDNPSATIPVVTMLIIALNIALWLVVQGMGTEPALTRSLCNFALVPGELFGRIPPGTELPMTPQVSCFRGHLATWMTPFTSMFMHLGWFHIIANMWFLWVFGNNVEDAMGPLRFAVFYVACGLAAVAADAAIRPASPIPMVGASGAIGGVMGAYALLHPRARVQTLFIFVIVVRTIWVPAWVMLGYWFVLQLIGGLPALSGVDGGGVAFWAHVGGFAAGLALVTLFRRSKPATAFA